MRSSLLSRNVLLISGVVASHLLVLFGLLSKPFGGEKLSVPNMLTINLVGERKIPSSPKTFPIASQINAPVSKGSLSSRQADEVLSPNSVGENSHLVNGSARQTMHSPKPLYPLSSRKLREQGLVIVKLCVNEQGIVGEAGISKSSGFHSLDQSALSTLAQWRFAPMTVSDASRFSQCFQTPVQFRLEG